MKKTMLRNLIIVLVIVAVLGVGLYLLTRPKSEEETEASPSISLFTDSRENIGSIGISNEYGSFTLVSDEKGSWSFLEQPNIPVHQTNANNLAYTCASVYAQEKLTDRSENLADYGLNPPKATVVITLKDGQTKTVFLGNPVATQAMNYFQIEGDPAVYLVNTPTWENVTKGIEAFYDSELPPIEDTTLASILIKQEDGTELRFTQSGEGAADSGTNYLSQWQMEAPYQMEADSEAVETDIVGNLMNLTANNIVSTNPEDFKTYHLEPAKASVTVTGQGGSEYVYYIGDSTDSGTYLATNRNEMVYLVSGKNLEFVHADAFQFVNKYVVTVPSKRLNQLTVMQDGVTTEFRAEEKTGEDGTATYTYYRDNKPVEEAGFRTMYETLLSIKYEGRVTEPPTEKTATSRIVLIDSDGTAVTLDFLPYRERYYAVFRNGVGQFYCQKKSLDALKEAIKAVK